MFCLSLLCGLCNLFCHSSMAGEQEVGTCSYCLWEVGTRLLSGLCVSLGGQAGWLAQPRTETLAVYSYSCHQFPAWPPPHLETSLGLRDVGMAARKGSSQCAGHHAGFHGLRWMCIQQGQGQSQRLHNAAGMLSQVLPGYGTYGCPPHCGHPRMRGGHGFDGDVSLDTCI